MFRLKKTFLSIFLLLLLLMVVICACASIPINEKIVIPFTMKNNRIVIKATVNGVEGKYVWDTGSFDSHTFIPIENLTPIPEGLNQSASKSYYIEDGIIIKNQIIKSKSIIHHIPSHTNTQWDHIVQYLKEEGLDGFFGIALFNGWWVEVLFSKSRIILHKQMPKYFIEYANAKTTFQGMHNWRGAFFISGNIDGIPIEFLLDTGAPDAFNFPHMLREYFNADYRKIITIDDIYYEIPTSSISILGDVFENKSIVTNSWAENFGMVIIGMEFLQKYDILFNMSTLRSEITRLYYKKNIEKENKEQFFSGVITPSPNPFGIQVWLKEKGFLVDKVTIPGFSHDELGIRPGMMLIKFNGRDLGGLELRELSRILTTMRNKNGVLTVLNTDGTEIVITR